MNKFLKKMKVAVAVAAFVGGGLFMTNTNVASAYSLETIDAELGGGGGGCKGAGACVLKGKVYDYAPCNC